MRRLKTLLTHETKASTATPANLATADHRDIPALDGLRALAVIGVILVHICPATLPGGFMGVDVFFVLSGFLITSIIHKDLLAGTFSFKEFYLRRIQRLLPNAVLTVAATVLLLLLLDPWSMGNQAGRHGIWVLLNLSNIFAYKFLGGYWGDVAESAPFTHFWSLGIEEQFYLVFPLTFFLLFKIFRGNKKGILILLVLGLLAILSYLFCLKTTYHDQPSAFYLPHYRIWELLAGAVLALFARPFVPDSTTNGHSRRMNWISGMIGIALVLVSYSCFSEKDAFPGWVALLSVVGTFLVLFNISGGNGFLSRALSMRPLVQIGKYSYSLYLWHWPAIIIGKGYFGFESPVLNATLGGLCGVILAIAAYYFVERPLRKRGKGRRWRLAVLTILFFTTVGICFFAKKIKSTAHLSFDPIYWSNCYEPRHGGCSLPVILEGNEKNVTWVPGWSTTNKDVRVYKFISPIVQTPEMKNAGFEKRFGMENSPRVLVVGDSQMEMYAYLIEEIFKPRKWNMFYDIFGGSRIFYEKSPLVSIVERNIAVSVGREEKILKRLEDWKPDILIMSELWNSYSPDYLEKRFDHFLGRLQTRGTRVILLCPLPRSVRGTGTLRDFVKKTSVLDEAAHSKVGRAKVQAVFDKMAAKYPNVILVRPDKLFLKPDGTIYYAKGRKFYYMDDCHLSIDGAELTRPLFEEAINKALNITGPKPTDAQQKARQ